MSYFNHTLLVIQIYNVHPEHTCCIRLQAQFIWPWTRQLAWMRLTLDSYPAPACPAGCASRLGKGLGLRKEDTPATTWCVPPDMRLAIVFVRSLSASSLGKEIVYGNLRVSRRQWRGKTVTGDRVTHEIRNVTPVWKKLILTMVRTVHTRVCGRHAIVCRSGTVHKQSLSWRQQHCLPWWLQIPWYQSGAKPSSTIILAQMLVLFHDSKGIDIWKNEVNMDINRQSDD